MNKLFWISSVINSSKKRIPNPTREQVCSIYVGFQGVTFNSSQYGPIPVFGPESNSLNDEDFRNYVLYLQSLGYTHIEFALSWNYSERDYSYPVPGRDCSSDEGLDFLLSRMNFVADCGMFNVLFLAGDGESRRDSEGNYIYNDPQGWTYGYEWLLDNIDRILTRLSPILPWTAFVPGYDGVFYGWLPIEVKRFGTKCRSINSKINLGLEHDEGHIPLGEGGFDYLPGGLMDDYDFVLSEFNYKNLAQNSTWQVMARLVPAGTYKRDPRQTDDPNPPFYLHDCSRGKRIYIPYEYDTFPWVRGLKTAEEVRVDRAYLQSLAPGTIIC